MVQKVDTPLADYKQTPHWFWQLYRRINEDTIDGTFVDGIVLKDNAGTPHYWLITIDSTGALVSTDLGTTPP